MTHISKITLLLILVSVLILPNFVFAADENLEEECDLVRINGQQDMSKEDYQSLLKRCQDFYQSQIENLEKDITKTGQEKTTLQNKIWSLSNKIKNLDYQIYQSNLVIKDLGIQIEDTETSIDKTALKIEKSKEKLTQILRTIYEEDQKPLIEILLSEGSISDFFDDLVALEILNDENIEFLENIKNLRSNLEQQNQDLGEEKGDLEQTVQIYALQKNESAKTKREQEYYFNITEQEYQKHLQEEKNVKEKAAEIAARLFELAGIGVSKAPSFGEAYEIAKYVKMMTGVRPAFLLAILQQESALGKNVGQCYLKDSSTGAGVSIRSGTNISRVMKPSRDVQPFLKITQQLGRDPYNTPISCPWIVGWGGAMGPAQFIPSTWILYKDRIQEILGRPADPWNIEDAFLASAVYLADVGAATQTKNGEWRAAMIYFSGSTTNSRFYWYANSVLKIADDFQKDIEALEAVE